MTQAKGPIWVAGTEEITSNGYKILFLPDVNNDVLQREGKAPVYWWLPNEVRLARRDGDAGDYLFSLLHFVGVRQEETHVGAEGTEEVAGGLLAFSTTAAPPGAILQEATDALREKFRGSDAAYWGWRTPATPMFRSAPIVSNVTSVTDLNPMDDGAIPQPAPPPPAGPPRNRMDRLRASMPPDVVATTQLRSHRSPRTVTRSPNTSVRNRNLDEWYVKLQGQGEGTVTPFAINSYSGLLGTYPTALIWETFHGGSAAFSVYQNMMIRVWSPVVTLTIEGEWDEVQDHFSAAGHAGGLFWGADIQTEFNHLATSGGITVRCQVDRSLPDADKLEAELNKRKDLVFQTFMQQAQKTIFDPAPFNEKPAEATGGFLGWGGGVAFKLRQDRTHLSLTYTEETEYAYLQPFPIRGQMEGLQAEIAADPAAEKRYFRTLYLGDWDRKVSRIVEPVVNWPDASRKWVGEPVAYVTAQIGYPNTEGVLQWDTLRFTANDSADVRRTSSIEMKKASDVSNAPQGWTPDSTFVKRKIHFLEPPKETEYPHVRVQIERNEVDLDEGDLGTLSNETDVEVRVDNVGALSLGPIELEPVLEGNQLVEATFRALGRTADGNERQPVRFRWKPDDQSEGRYWFVFTGDRDFVAKYQYQVKVVVRGSIFGGGQEWTGPWEENGGNGPFLVRVPSPDGANVRRAPLNGSMRGRSKPPTRRKGSTTGSGPTGKLAHDQLGAGKSGDGPPAVTRQVASGALRTARAEPTVKGYPVGSRTTPGGATRGGKDLSDDGGDGASEFAPFSVFRPHD